MKSPQYIRQNSSFSQSEDDFNQNQSLTNYNSLLKNNLQISLLNNANVTGLRKKKLLILVFWLLLLTILSIILISVNYFKLIKLLRYSKINNKFI